MDPKDTERVKAYTKNASKLIERFGREKLEKLYLAGFTVGQLYDQLIDVEGFDPGCPQSIAEQVEIEEFRKTTALEELMEEAFEEIHSEETDIFELVKEYLKIKALLQFNGIDNAETVASTIQISIGLRGSNMAHTAKNIFRLSGTNGHE